MSLSLSLLSNPFVTVIVDRNETKGNLRKNRLTNTTDYYKVLTTIKSNNKTVKLIKSNQKKTKIHLKQVLNQSGPK